MTRHRGPHGQAQVKTMQLCKQVQRILTAELACCPEDALQSLQVVDVTPAQGTSQLLVQVAPSLAEDSRPVEETLAALGEASGRLRTAVAESINRRKAPTLLFQVLPSATPPQK